MACSIVKLSNGEHGRELSTPTTNETANENTPARDNPSNHRLGEFIDKIYVYVRWIYGSA